MAEPHLAANAAYGLAPLYPDPTKGGSWKTDLLVFTERDYLVRLRLREILTCPDRRGGEERLLRARVWWERFCATDPMLEVDDEKILCREMV